MFQVKVESTMLCFCWCVRFGQRRAFPCRFWQERTGMQWCIMGSNLREEWAVACSPPSTSSSSRCLETVSFSWLKNKHHVVTPWQDGPAWYQFCVCFILLTHIYSDTLLNVFLAIAVDNLANAQELTKVVYLLTHAPWILSPYPTIYCFPLLAP